MLRKLAKVSFDLFRGRTGCCVQLQNWRLLRRNSFGEKHPQASERENSNPSQAGLHREEHLQEDTGPDLRHPQEERRQVQEVLEFALVMMEIIIKFIRSNSVRLLSRSFEGGRDLLFLNAQ